MEVKKSSFVKVFLLFLFFAISIILSLLLGAQKLNFNELFTAGTFSNLIFIKLRLPRTLLALLAGALLAGSGGMFQMFFRNPLAEPGILGISSGATLGAVIAAGISSGSFFSGIISPVNIGAFIGAVCAGFLVTVIAFGASKASTVSLLLCGTALSSLFSAFTSILIYSDNSELRSLYIWMLGSFNSRGWNELKFILLPSIIAFILILLTSRKLDYLCGGEITAASLGININTLRLFVILSGAFAVSAAVTAAGTIGFVGLVAPHLVRLLFKSRSNKLIPLSMVTGSTLLLLADTICRIIVPPAEIPVGTVTALIGAPFFISLIFTREKSK